MPRKPKVEVQVEVQEEATHEPEVKPSISKIEFDFGREDLNKLRDKVNEIIETLP